MKVAAIIPARMAASRFPDKPLKPILGLPMIEHVRRRVLLSPKVDEVVVATCDKSIFDVVHAAGGRAVMTADTYERCTDRIAEAARNMDADIYINVQGDEPLVLPEMMDQIVAPFFEDPTLECVNLAVPIVDDAEFNDVNAVKVVTNVKDEMIYASREPIPSRSKAPDNNFRKLKQLGIIAFSADFLQKFTELPATPLEEVESVDMLRAVEHGYRVQMVETGGVMIGVDLPGDIARVEKVLENDPLVEKYM